MRDVAIIGVGMIRFGELWDRSLRDLFVEAALAALDDAGVDHVDSLVVGCMSSGLFNGQEHLASLLADYLGVAPAPATRVESACASGALALKVGLLEVACGVSDVVLVGGVEKMTDLPTPEVTYALSTAADQEWEGFHGITFPGLYALIARAHMERFGTTRRQLAAVAAKNHANGAKNPHAQYRRPVSIEAVMNSIMVADPLRILDCSPISDGAAAAVLCPLETAAKLSSRPPVRIAGLGHATDTIALHARDDLTDLRAVRLAAERAYAMAGRKPGDVDFAEVHDCFTIAELCVIEALGLVERGRSGPLTEEGATALDGAIPVNPSGGLKAKGHPVGATGVAQVHEAVLQLRGEAGERQVPEAKIGLTQNMGGSGGSSVVTILEAM